MKRSTIVVALVVLAVIATGALYFFYLRPASQPPQAQLPELISLLPADATTIAYADCAALRASPFVGRLLAILPAPAQDNDYTEFVQATGFDYSRDLDRIAIAVREREPTTSSAAAFAVAEGRFDRRRITSYLLRNGQRAVRQDGLEAYEVPSSKPGRPPIAVTFLSDTRVVINDGYRTAAQTNRVSESLAPATRERIARVAGSALFAVTQVPANTKNIPGSGWFSDQLVSVRWLMLAGQPQGDTLFIALDAECESSTSALNLSLTLEGFRAVGRVAFSDPKSRDGLDAATSELLDTVLRESKITRAENNVRIGLTLGPQWLDSLAKSVKPPLGKSAPPAR